MQREILDMSHTRLREWFVELGEKPFRANQLWHWLWFKQGQTFQDMTTLSKQLRATLDEKATLTWPTVETVKVSTDSTVKFLLKLADGELVETVLIPEKTHYTQCLSTQVGCAMGCSFCSTGQMGLTRNMTMGEICGQILVARRYIQEQGADLRLKNLVFMGMGEPLANYDNLMDALETITNKDGINISPRRITVSTIGLTKHLHDLGHSGLASLAVSLHAPNQELRASLMPIAAKIPLDTLIEELRTYPLKNRQRITFEYILLKGVNDSLEHARELAKLLRRLKCKVNLIAYNAGPDAPFQAPEYAQIEAFEKVLWDKGMTCVLRRSKGQDIDAACGQLKVAHQSGE